MITMSFFCKVRHGCFKIVGNIYHLGQLLAKPFRNLLNTFAGSVSRTEIYIAVSFVIRILIMWVREQSYAIFT